MRNQYPNAEEQHTKWLNYYQEFPERDARLAGAQHLIRRIQGDALVFPTLYAGMNAFLAAWALDSCDLEQSYKQYLETSMTVHQASYVGLKPAVILGQPKKDTKEVHYRIEGEVCNENLKFGHTKLNNNALSTLFATQVTIETRLARVRLSHGNKKRVSPYILRDLPVVTIYGEVPHDPEEVHKPDLYMPSIVFGAIQVTCSGLRQAVDARNEDRDKKIVSC